MNYPKRFSYKKPSPSPCDDMVEPTTPEKENEISIRLTDGYLQRYEELRSQYDAALQAGRIRMDGSRVTEVSEARRIACSKIRVADMQHEDEECDD